MLEEIKDIHFSAKRIEKIIAADADHIEERLIKIVIPDAGPINTLAAAGLLYLLLAPKNTLIVMIHTVINEIIHRTPEFLAVLKEFIEDNLDRITIVKTSVCADDEARSMRGEPLGKRRGDLAIADFILNYIDEAIGDSPALIICEDRTLVHPQSIRHAVNDYPENTHFITTEAYLRKLEQEHIISSFDVVWKQVSKATCY